MTVPEPCKVLGTALKPFCLGHHLLFKRLGLLFCGHALADVSEEDILVGIAICAGESYEKTLEQFLTGEWTAVFEKWLKDMRSAFAARLLRRRKFNKNLIKDAEILFRAYLQDGYQPTPVWKHDIKGGISLSAPWELVLKNRLVMAGYAETEVLNGYLPARWYDYYTVSELQWASKCKDEKKWRKIFYTQEDAKAINAKPNPQNQE